MFQDNDPPLTFRGIQNILELHRLLCRDIDLRDTVRMFQVSCLHRGIDPLLQYPDIQVHRKLLFQGIVRLLRLVDPILCLLRPADPNLYQLHPVDPILFLLHPVDPFLFRLVDPILFLLRLADPTLFLLRLHVDQRHRVGLRLQFLQGSIDLVSYENQTSSGRIN